MKLRRPWYRWAVLAYDRRYRRLHGLDGPGSEVGPVVRIEVRRSPRARALPDGTPVGRGDHIGILHVNNDRIAALRDDGRSPIAVGFEVRRELLASLGTLARLVGPGGPLSDVRAFTATTIFHQGLARLGFQPEANDPADSPLVAAPCGGRSAGTGLCPGAEWRPSFSEPTGAQEVNDNVTQRTLKVIYEPDRVARPAIVQAIEAAGHRVEATP